MLQMMKAYKNDATINFDGRSNARGANFDFGYLNIHESFSKKFYTEATKPKKERIT